MTHSIFLRPAARLEIDQHVIYLHFHASPRIAERFVAVLQKSLAQLSRMPEVGTELPVRRLMLSGIRYWPVKKPFQKYVIYYRIEKARIEIVHVLHGARDAEQVLDD